MKRFGFPSLVVVLGVICAALFLLSDRQTQGQSSDTWRQLSLSDFVIEMDRITSSDTPVSDALWTEIRSQSAERLLAAGGTAADYGDLVSLYLWAQPSLTPAQNESVLAGLSPETSQVSGWSFDKLQSVHDRMDQAQMPAESVKALTLSWLEDRDVRTIQDVQQLGWLAEQIQQADWQADVPTEVTAEWTGSVAAPAAGSYTFSTSPLDLDFKFNNQFCQQTLALWVGGQQVLDTAAEGGSHESKPVSLAANSKTAVRIKFTYACSDQSVFESRPAIALLQWKSDAVSKRPVPTNALSTPTGQPGLQGQYALKAGEKETRITRVDPQLAFIWYHGGNVVPQHEALRAPLAEQLFRVASSASTLAAWESEGSAKQDDWVGANWAFLHGLDLAQQKRWAETLLAHPVLIEDGTRLSAIDLYRRLRVGAPDEALQILGRWAQANASEQPTMAVDFYEANRKPYRWLARQMVFQLAGQLDQLEEDFLVLPDGSCSLPVAYTLSYGYWLEKRMPAWIDKLEAQLENQQLAGDQRVNWLLARAQAEEIRRSRSSRYYRTMDHFLAGEGWIQEALLVAPSEPVKLRAFHEWAARLTVDERISEARQVLDQAQQKCTSASSSELLTTWRAELDGLDGAFRQRHEQQELAARNAYVDRLKKRHQSALASGDSQATSRYEQLLSDAGAATE